MSKRGALVFALFSVTFVAVMGNAHATNRTGLPDARRPLARAGHRARSVWDSVYTAEQAKRGELIYQKSCSRCHTATLVGLNDSPPLTGREFLANWNHSTVAELHDKVLTSMPSDSAGILKREQVTDVLTYLFSYNGFPAGKAEMPSDAEALKAIRIEASKPEGKPEEPHAPWPPVATFSILAYDPGTGEVGGAVQSRVFSVGNGVLWAEAGVGAAATQAIVDVGYGPSAIELLRKGVVPDSVIRQIWDADPDPRPQDWPKEGRQFAVIDAKGNVAAYTGPKATVWAGNRPCAAQGTFCTAQGNILAGAPVVDSMVAAFERAEGELSLRLLAALEAGQLAGGDKRGMQSAAMLIVKKDGGVWLHNDTVLRLQVDDNPEPIKELRRLVEKAVAQRRR
jgi:uncharacterized Ntn-hydrolase superfamily protein/mono/diheme cytochrome c family protein